MKILCNLFLYKYIVHERQNKKARNQTESKTVISFVKYI